DTGSLTYSIAGHDPPLLVDAGGTVTELPMTKGVALGIAPDVVYTQETVTLAPGDTVILFTDGVTEAMNPDNQQFEMKRLSEVFEGSPPVSASEANTAVFERVREFAGDAPQSDDITCLVLRRS
ncbi:MAG: PP2C family protein-serine/threonine phosphatase, partial [Rhodospirillaceae bacterium]|nr:PP2C family protein-serine/threonine phosphatase [Rhodospirillaceae bacterium]